ncbi:High mobility group B protein 5 [Capsicum baccatum]|uniref:High mobility group B protein 5 n=1 Tax=Capsicum baccatum TaxID=33114 RepID=A0A2G2V4H0_CAPBA|nr:High mobility group B protein 5 [Capsicum baccatum]
MVVMCASSQGHFSLCMLQLRGASIKSKKQTSGARIKVCDGKADYDQYIITVTFTEVLLSVHNSLVLRKKEKSTEPKAKREKKPKNPNAPKRPPTSLFVFMDEFRQTFKAANPDRKRVSTVVLNSVVPNNNLLLPLYPFSFI